MAKLFVHGNPETADIWTSLIEGLRDLGVSDAEAISPPGFGSPLPETFEPTQLGYRQWLIDQLEAAGGDVDLVGAQPVLRRHLLQQHVRWLLARIRHLHGERAAGPHTPEHTSHQRGDVGAPVKRGQGV